MYLHWILALRGHVSEVYTVETAQHSYRSVFVLKRVILKHV